MNVRVDNLTKQFGDTLAVNQLSFVVEPGMVTGFVGPNGSGKSTTMRMMLGLLQPDSGSVRFGDRPYGELATPRHTIGAVVDRIGAHPRHSANDHLQMIATAAGIPVTRVDACLREVGLDDVADKPLGRYSLGMTQRCALAAALLGDPEVLLLDEPSTGLDPSGIRWLRDKMQMWASEGRTVFVSTHHLAELAPIVDDVVVVNRGNLVFTGSGDELRGTSSLEDALVDLLSDPTHPEMSTR